MSEDTTTVTKKHIKCVGEMNTRDIHDWFGLSYAQYLTLPRSIMEAMPDEWQKQMTKLLEELDDTYDWHPKDNLQYWVTFRNISTGRYTSITHDPLMHYRHPDYKYIESLKKPKEE